MDIRSLLARKGSQVEYVRPDTDVLTAARLLRAKGVGALVVSPDGARVDGLVSERDVVVGLAEHPDLIGHQRVSEVMNRAPVTASPGDRVNEVMAQMTRRRQRQVPVVDAGRIVGVVSVGDILHALLDEATLETSVLRDVAIARS